VPGITSPASGVVQMKVMNSESSASSITSRTMRWNIGVSMIVNTI
jgi:hypothetical protein